MPGHKGQNRFRYSKSESPDNPAKKKKPNDSLSSAADEDSDESVLSNILERAPLSEEGILRITSVILANPAIKNAVSVKLISELDKLKSEVKSRRSRPVFTQELFKIFRYCGEFQWRKRRY